MKPLNKILSILFVLGAFTALLGLLHAQDTATPTQLLAATLNGTPTEDETTGVDVMLQAIEGTTPYPATIATNGSNFYSAQHAPGSEEEWPPLPGDVLELNVWPLGDGVFILDDRNVDYNALQRKSLVSGGMRTMDDSGSPSPDGGGYSPDDLTPQDYGTNLWLAITNLTGSTANLLLSNTVGDIQYEIQGKANLTDTQWISEGFVLGSELTNSTPTSVTVTNYPTKFLRVRSWADDGSGLPIWWQLQYFGYIGVDPNGNPEGDGWSNIQKFEYGWNPFQYYTPPVLPSTNAPPPTFTLVSGPQGNFYVIGSGLPPNLSAIRISRQSDLPGWLYDDEGITDLPNGYFDIPASSVINGIAQIPVSEAYSFGEYAFEVNAILSNGTNTSSNSLGYDFNSVFVDGRAQLKDNVRFLLRTASANVPFEINRINQPTNYVYSGFFDASAKFDPLAPFENNYLYRNFDFDINNMVPTDDFTVYGEYQLFGMPDGVYYGSGWFANDPLGSGIYTNNITYQINFASFITTNGVVAPAPLNVSQASWLFPPDDSDFVGGFQADQNQFGLSYVSEISPYYTNGTFLSETFYTNAPPTSPPGGFYFDTVQPDLQIASYYFARAGVDPMPEQGAYPAYSSPTVFYTTNITPLLIAGVGQSMPQLAGYAKMTITNGYSGTYAYLGQYFDKAYKITNGIVTTNITGVLSPYGNFFATDPGMAALVTMPDIDPPYQRGTCTVYCVGLQLDKNHDGNMDSTFNGPDFTSTNSPYLLWANNNFDRAHPVDFGTDNEQDDLQVVYGYNGSGKFAIPDCNYLNGNGNRAIPCARDLEDFTRLWISGVTSNLLAALPSGSTITLNWGDAISPNSSNPTIDLFAAADTDGGIGYLTNSAIAALQTNIMQSPFLGRLAPGGSIQLNTIQFANNWAGNHFIWCGVSNGTGGLNLTIADANGNVLAQSTVSIQIVDIKQMYERWTVGDDPSSATNQLPLNVAIKATDDLPYASPAFQYPPPQNTNTPYILFVHGWNMPTWEKNRYAETAFKRLYWQGYQGRFGSFRWPTFSGFPLEEFSAQSFNPRNFDNSESNAWASAAGLLNKLTGLNAEYPGQVYLMAHSMGNVVAGEALRLAGTNHVVNTYIAMQAALSAHAYDTNTPTRDSTASTPDDYAHYWTNGAICYFNNSAGAGTYVNFFNTNDWALTGLWPIDQNAKPDNSITGYPGYHYSVSGLHPNGFYVQFGSGAGDYQNLNFPGDTYTIFSYCDEARSYALGAQANVNGKFTGNQLDLKLSPYNFGNAHKYHSGEFRSDDSQRWQFWNEVLITFELKQP